MPIVTINKTIALFLVGYLGLGVAAVVAHRPILNSWRRHPELAGLAGSVILALLSLAVAALIGATIDGLADVTIRRFIKWAAKKERFARFFGQSRVFHSAAKWELCFNDEAKQAN